MSGYWYVFKIVDGAELYQGRVDATSEGWKEMGCDLYTRLYEAELIADPEKMEAAEVDTDKSIVLIYGDSLSSENIDDYIVYFSEVDLHQPLAIHDERLGNEDICHRFLDFHGIGKDNGWQCENDCTGCMYNDGHNTCFHVGLSQNPLEE